MATQSRSLEGNQPKRESERRPPRVVGGAPHGFGVWIDGKFHRVDIGALGTLIVRRTEELEAVEWTDDDPIAAHTITFGLEPQDLVNPSSNVTVDADGARHGVLNSTSDVVHSGFIQAAPQDPTGLAQAPSGVTRFRVTFSKPGIYSYICSLHDVLGMKGSVVVLR